MLKAQAVTHPISNFVHSLDLQPVLDLGCQKLN